MASDDTIQAIADVNAMSTASSARGGFTLMEILVALIIGSTIIGAGRALFDITVGAQRSLQSSVSRVVTGRVAVYEIQRAVRAGRASGSAPFIGTSDEVSFESWCPDGYAGMARCAVRVSAKPNLSITEQLATGSRHSWVADSVEGRLDFVVNASSLEPTVSKWESASSTPQAIRWVSFQTHVGSGDTLLFEILRSAP